MTENSTVYVYKLTVDNNGAPCVWNGRLSLAICKPAIRRTAPMGSCIFGFAGNTMAQRYPGNPLIYAAKVTELCDGRVYYREDGCYSNRPDCIYRFNGARFEWRPRAAYHQNGTALEHDLGRHPEYDRARVLLSDNFRYFGNSGPVVNAGPVRNLLDHLAQGHRVNLTRAAVDALIKLWAEIFSQPQQETRAIFSDAIDCSCDSENEVATNDPDFSIASDNGTCPC